MSEVSQACLLIYDIPEEAPVANPSGLLRRFGLRVNKSCWVIREKEVNHPDVLRRLQVMRDNGVVWHTVKFDIGETDKLVEMAVTWIHGEVRKTVGSIRNRIAEEETTLGDAAAPLADREKRYKTAARAAVRRGMRMIADIREAYGRFGVTANVYAGFLDAMSGNVSQFDAQVKARCESFTTAVRNVRKAVRTRGLSEGTNAEIRAATRAVESQAMPADIFADFMDDHDIDGAAELRDAFSPSAGI